MAQKEETKIAKAEVVEEERVPLILFGDDDQYKDDVYIAVNCKTYQIKRNVEVMVPKSVKEVWDNSQKQQMSLRQAQSEANNI